MKKHDSNCQIKLIKIIIATFTTSALLITSNLFAQSASTNPAINTQLEKDISSELSNAIAIQFSNLKTEISDLFYAGFQFINQQNYQTDPDLPAIQQANTTKQNVTVGNTTIYNYGKVGPDQISAAYAQQITQNNMDNTLKQSVFAMQPSLQTTLKDANNNNFYNYMQQNNVEALSGVQSNQSSNNSNDIIYPANDNLYISQNTYNSAIGNSSFSSMNEKLNLKPYLLAPSSPQNAIFNFGSLITPIAYDPTANQEVIAHDFIKYVTQNTMNLLTDPNNPTQYIFQALSNPSQSTQSAIKAATQADAIYQLSQNPVYQNFKYNLRTFLALRSISINMLNQLASERTVVPGLGTTAGLKDSSGPISNASPLQVESYIANHRIQDSSWYSSIENASPATLQRKTLIVLAEIEHQNYEAHLDRERLLAAITALNIMMNDQNMQAYLQKTLPDVQTAVQNAITKAKNDINQGGATTTTTTTTTTATDTTDYSFGTTTPTTSSTDTDNQ